MILIIVAVVVLGTWLWFTPHGILGKADAIGFAVCHRIDIRSFHLGDRQIPVCARCTGQYLGAMLSLLYLSIFRPRRIGRPGWGILLSVIALAIFYAVDGMNSYIHLFPKLSRFYLYEPNNVLRLFTGTGLGIGMGVMLFPAFNQTFWKTRDPGPIFNGYHDFLGLILLALIIDFLVLSENPLALYPLALVSAGGVLFLLMMVYSLVVVMLFKMENSYDRLIHGISPFLSGFVIAIVQIAVMDWIRFLLMGSWDGFHFG